MVLIKPVRPALRRRAWKRRSARACAVSAVLLAMVWIASAWMSVGIPTRDGRLLVFISGGVAGFSYTSFADPEYTERRRAELHSRPMFMVDDEVDLDWWFLYSNSSSRLLTSRVGYVPLWVPVVLLGVGSVVLFRSTRVKPGACGSCGYSRAGLAVETACPECGTAAPPSPAARASSV